MVTPHLFTGVQSQQGSGTTEADRQVSIQLTKSATSFQASSGNISSLTGSFIGKIEAINLCNEIALHNLFLYEKYKIYPDHNRGNYL